MEHLTILYRGPLASCDYDCPYCPFAKRRDTPEQLRADRAALERFTRWVAECGHRISVLFTPWGGTRTVLVQARPHRAESPSAR